MSTDPLAPKVMPDGDAVCSYCDTGKASQCPYHFNDTGGSIGLFQFRKWDDSAWIGTEKRDPLPELRQRIAALYVGKRPTQ